MDPYGLPRKRPRSDAAAVNGNGVNGHAAGTGGSNETECRRFNTPEGCPYGDACRFRHVPASSSVPTALPAISPATAQQPLPPGELRATKALSWTFDSIYLLSRIGVLLLLRVAKKLKRLLTSLAEKEPSGGLQSASNRTKPCTKFFSTSGCPYGEGCHFLHYVPGGVGALGLSPLPALGSCAGFPSGGGPRKVIGGVGPAGLAVPVSPSDQGANLGGFKTRLCNRFDTPEGCRFGEKCHFAHGEKELRKSHGAGGSNDRESVIDLSRGRGSTSASSGSQQRGQNGGSVFANEARSYGGGRDSGRAYSLREPTPPGLAAAASFGASSSAKISIEASLAGAIIGKGGVNAKQICRLTGAKLSIREHETDATLRNVEMEGSLDQIKQASQMVRQVLMQRDNVPVKHAGNRVG
ncbi:unnamed protein product [Calypogeia fissa]